MTRPAFRSNSSASPKPRSAKTLPLLRSTFSFAIAFSFLQPFGVHFLGSLEPNLMRSRSALLVAMPFLDFFWNASSA